MTQIAVSVATPYDVAALHPLIERAYRGDTAKAGWTHAVSYTHLTLPTILLV